MATDRKKREWLDLGAAAFARVCPGMFDQPTYACPICLAPFTIEALADKRLSAKHVPPKSVGGCELLLTCKVCNNSAGTKLDADAKTKEDVRIAMAGIPANALHAIPLALTPSHSFHRQVAASDACPTAGVETYYAVFGVCLCHWVACS